MGASLLSRVVRWLFRLTLVTVVLLALLLSYWILTTNSKVAATENVPFSEGAPGEYFDIQGFRIHVRTLGSPTDPPILLLHGFGPGGGFGWGALLNHLSTDFFLILPDMLGSGHSERVLEPGWHYTHGGRAAGIRTLLDRLDLESPVHVIGASFGGGVAAQLALDSPESVGRVVLLDPQIYKLGGGIFQFLGSLPLGLGRALTWYGQGAGSEERLRSGLAQGCARGGFCPDQNYIEKLVALRQIDGTTDAFRAISLTQIESRLPDEVSSIRHPTLVIWGELDNLIPVEEGRRLAAELPDARLEIIEEAGHSPSEDRPEEVAQLIRAFLKE